MPAKGGGRWLWPRPDEKNVDAMLTLEFWRFIYHLVNDRLDERWRSREVSDGLQVAGPIRMHEGEACPLQPTILCGGG